MVTSENPPSSHNSSPKNLITISVFLSTRTCNPDYHQFHELIVRSVLSFRIGFLCMCLGFFEYEDEFSPSLSELHNNFIPALLRIPKGFGIILCGKDVIHHNIVDDMMLTQMVTYKPTQPSAEGTRTDQNMVALVTIGYVKEAKDLIIVQGFNVYHKYRLIKV